MSSTLPPGLSADARAEALPARPTRRAVLQAGGALLLAVLAPRPARGAQILGVRVWPAADYTRVTLENDSDLKATHFVAANPHRLVVDIEGLDLSPTLKTLVAKVKPGDPYINQVRVGQNRPHVVRLVFDLKEEIKPQVFTLAPVGEYKHRLIFDLYPARPVDPLAALIEKGEWSRNGVAIPPQPETAAAPAKAEADKGKPAGKTGTPALADAQAGKGSAAAQPGKASADAAGGKPAAAEANKPAAEAGRNPALTDGRAPATDGKTPPAGDAAKPAADGRHAGKPGDMQRLLTIVLDPGHGGEDPGAIGAKGSREKDVVLDIARRLKQKIEEHPNMRVMLTRDGDYFVPLPVRVQKARKVQADLFVSIHADAFVEPRARGSSVFVLSEKGASSTAARWLANKENAADLIGGANLKGHDVQLASVLLDLSTTAQISDSLKVGKAVLGEIGGINKLHRGLVEQAGFAVLKAPDIPSILIETAFISNPEEEARLLDEDYQDKLAGSVFKGIRKYFAKNPPLAKSRTA